VRKPKPAFTCNFSHTGIILSTTYYLTAAAGLALQKTFIGSPANEGTHENFLQQLQVRRGRNIPGQRGLLPELLAGDNAHFDIEPADRQMIDEPFILNREK
jgi:hypothetical protein